MPVSVCYTFQNVSWESRKKERRIEISKSGRLESLPVFATLPANIYQNCLSLHQLVYSLIHQGRATTPLRPIEAV